MYKLPDIFVGQNKCNVNRNLSIKQRQKLVVSGLKPVINSGMVNKLLFRCLSEVFESNLNFTFINQLFFQQIQSIDKV